MHFRNSQVDKPRTSVAEPRCGSPGALGKDNEGELVKGVQSETTENTDVCEDANKNVETSFKHLWNDYGVDWRDTRRYPADATAAPRRKLCMSVFYLWCHSGVIFDENDVMV